MSYECIGSDLSYIFLGVNWRYMREALDHVAPAGGPVTLQIVNPNTPMLVTGPLEGYGALLMPMCVKESTPSLQPVRDLAEEMAERALSERYCPERPPLTNDEAAALLADPEPAPIMAPVFPSRDFDTQAQREPEPYYTASPRLTSTPQVGAVVTGLAIVDAYPAQEDKYKKNPRVLVCLQTTNPRPIPQPKEIEPERPVTKSERMSALNIERARIKREYKPGALRDEHLRALYIAFGNSQRKNPVPSWELPGLACGMNAHFNGVIISRRFAHNVTAGLVPPPAGYSKEFFARRLSQPVTLK